MKAVPNQVHIHSAGVSAFVHTLDSPDPALFPVGRIRPRVITAIYDQR